MLTKAQAHELASDWVSAWNAHDLDRIMAHYADDVELTSPVVVQRLQRPDGRVIGKADLRAYFQRGLEAYPQLRFELENVLWGVRSVVLYYRNQRGTRTAEYMEIAANGNVSHVVASYDG